MKRFTSKDQDDEHIDFCNFHLLKRWHKVNYAVDYWKTLGVFRPSTSDLGSDVTELDVTKLFVR